MSRELVFGTVQKYEWAQLGGLITHPEAGKIVDMSKMVAGITGVKDAYLKIYPVNQYGNEDILFAVMVMEKPDAIMIFTDPRQWGFIYALEKQIRKNVPLVFLNIWDNPPYPQYNHAFYESCDSLFSISKQTYNINKWVMRPENCITLDGQFDKDGKLVPNTKTN